MNISKRESTIAWCLINFLIGLTISTVGSLLINGHVDWGIVGLTIAAALIFAYSSILKYPEEVHNLIKSMISEFRNLN